MEDVDLDIKRILFYSASSIWVELSNQCQAVREQQMNLD